MIPQVQYRRCWRDGQRVNRGGAMAVKKVCPFCDKTEHRIESWNVEGGDNHTEYAVMCENCGAFGPNDLGKSGAIEMWNLRRPMNAATARAEQLEAELAMSEQIRKDCADTVNRMRQALESVEWTYTPDGCGGEELTCPWCGGYPIDDEERAAGIRDHTPDCQRQAALRATEGGEEEEGIGS